MTLKVHHLRPAPGAHTKKTRVGRGEGSKGKTAGRGTKGSGARVQVSARFEGGQTPLHMRLPKLSGFKNNNKVVFQVVNLDRIASLFPQGGSIDPDTLADAGAVRRGQPVKVLGTGELGGVKVDVQAHAFSKSAAREDRRCRGQHHRHLRRGPRLLPGGLLRPLQGPAGEPCEPAAACGQGWSLHSTRPTRGGHVLQAFAAAFRTPDLRRKLLFSLAMIAVYRLGASVPGPGVSIEAINSCLDQANASDQRDVYSLVNLFSGGALLRLSVFALGIMPYITASIIVQLLVVVIPRFEQLKKEGQSGQQKLTQYTRYLTIALGVLQSTGIIALARSGQLFPSCPSTIIPSDSVWTTVVAGHHADRRHRRHHVAGRAAHREGDRQRHVRADLHLDRRPHPRRGRRDPAEPRRLRLRR